MTLTCHYDVIKLHYKYHAGAREHTCAACGVAFMEARTLRQHELSRHHNLLPSSTTNTSATTTTTTTRSAACHICGKLVLKSNLKTHIRARHKEEGGGDGEGAVAASYAEQFSCLLCGHPTKTSWIKVRKLTFHH